MRLYTVTRKFISHIELQNNDNQPVGITATGSKLGTVIVKGVKKKSHAYRSQCVSEGDVILSIDGEDVKRLSSKHIRRLIRESTPRIRLELEYEISEICYSGLGVYRSRRMTIHLSKKSGSFGFILRKNEVLSTEYPTISNIKPGGPADKEGSMKAGDRLIQIDDLNVSWKCLSDVAAVLSEKKKTVLVLEYSITVIDYIRKKDVEVEIIFDCQNQDIGMKLNSLPYTDYMVIEEIRKGSLAERCGAFRTRDVIKSINDTSVTSLSISKANGLLQKFKKVPGKLVYIPQENAIGEPMASTSAISPGSTEATTSYWIDCKSCVNRPHFNSPSSAVRADFNQLEFPLSDEDNPCEFELQILPKFRDVTQSVSNLKDFVPFLLTDLDPEKHDDADHSHQEKISQLQALCKELTRTTFEFILNLINNNSHGGHNHIQDNSSIADGDVLIEPHSNRRTISDISENLKEIHSRKLISKHWLDNYLTSLEDTLLDCIECKKSCLLSLSMSHKLLLLLPFMNEDPNIPCVINKIIEVITQLKLPCDDCEKPWCSVSDFNNSPTNIPTVYNPENNQGLNIYEENGANMKNSEDRSKCEQKIEVQLDVKKELASCKFTKLNMADSQPHCSEMHSSYLKKQSLVNLETDSYSKSHRNKDLDRRRLKSSNWRSEEAVSASKYEFDLIAPPNSPKSSMAKHASVPIRFDRPTRSSLKSSVVHEPSTSAIMAEHNGGSSSSNNCSPQSFPEFNCRGKAPVKFRTTFLDVLLKDNGRGIGLKFEYIHPYTGDARTPFVTQVQEKSAADRSKVIFVGDRVVAINNESTSRLSDNGLDQLRKQAFAMRQVRLKVEIDISVLEVRFGTFDVTIDRAIKTGLKFESYLKASPLIVSGVVKGSVAHRSGLLFPGDEILFTNCIRQESFDSIACTYERKESVILTIKRENQPDSENGVSLKRRPYIPQESFLRTSQSFIVHRTNLRKVEEGPSVVLEQEVTLFRDPQQGDFGFLVGQIQVTGKVCVVAVRPDGPADRSKVIRKNDHIVQINGNFIEKHRVSNSVLSLFLEAVEDRMDLTTRRELRYQDG